MRSPTYLPDDTIPRPLYQALVKSNEGYYEELTNFLKTQDRHDIAISTTSLITSPQKKLLRSRHIHEIYVEPVKDLWASFIGSCIHLILELEAKKNPSYYVEVRMGVSLKVDGISALVHGKLDLYDRDNEAIEDWKITRPTSLMYDKTEHVMQLNVLRYIMLENGYKVKTLKDVYMFPHLDNAKIGMDKYPTRNVQVVEVPILPVQEVREYIKGRVKIHVENENKHDRDLTPCTDSERWIRGSVYKMYLRKKGSSSDVKKGIIQPFSSKAAHYSESLEEITKQASEYDGAGIEYNIAELKGSPKACEYCSGAPFCIQLKNEEKAKVQLEPSEPKGIFG